MNNEQPIMVYGVGLGPGDPDLVTLGALRVLESASVIIAPSTQLEVQGRAERIVGELLPGREVVQFLMPMARGRGGYELRLQLTRTLVRQLGDVWTTWESCAFVTLGDPLIYSTFSLFVEAMRAEGIPMSVSVVPGIPAFCDLAARTGTNLVDNDERLYLVPATADLSYLARALDDGGAAVVVYKLSANFGEVRALIDAAGRADEAVVGTQLGTQQAKVVRLNDAPSELPYFATAIVPTQRSSQ